MHRLIVLRRADVEQMPGLRIVEPQETQQHE